MIELAILGVVLQSVTLIGTIAILIFFTSQCLQFKQLNYDLSVMYPVLTRIAWARIFVTIVCQSCIIMYNFRVHPEASPSQRDELLVRVANVISSLIPFLHVLFFVLRLHMTFVNTNSPIPKICLFFYFILVITIFGVLLVYEMLDTQVISIKFLPPSTQITMFWTSEGLRLLLLLIISIHFSMKLIALTIVHYNYNNYTARDVERSYVGMLQYDNFHVLNNLSIRSGYTVRSHTTSSGNSLNTSLTSNDYGNGIFGMAGISSVNSTHSSNRNTTVQSSHTPGDSNNYNSNNKMKKYKNRQIIKKVRAQSKAARLDGQRHASFSLMQLDLIKIAAKQSVLTIVDFISLGSYIVYVICFYNQLLKNESITIVYFLLANFYYLVGNISVWFSFSFAEKQYYCACNICDKCCLKASKCVTRNRMNRLDNATVGINQQDFNL